MKKILIVGKKGFIGNSLYKYLKKYFDVKLVDFRTFTKTKKINNFNYIINCSINKNYAFKKYDKKHDFDLKICNKIKSYDIKQIFLSTRKIYENRDPQSIPFFVPNRHLSASRSIDSAILFVFG